MSRSKVKNNEIFGKPFLNKKVDNFRHKNFLVIIYNYFFRLNSPYFQINLILGCVEDVL